MPSLLQLALLACEFDNVTRFTRPPRLLQQLLFALLTPIARLRDYRGHYPEYIVRPPRTIVSFDEDRRPPLAFSGHR